ncbi:hypothetical protein MAPG_02102 [Magnaporthiopsis poae ATCC 64411]|uniref:Oxidase ustYa n=1 Tax=Magnaporthiopsis poae (strain ATCC 64411 / 73-15) TaxID=644358 RepID=A0A0C4DQG2_MAGP6|nr:hypothetical protein MAPG_02102 [Magnaporthiopsis poae ATCC 64411]
MVFWAKQAPQSQGYAVVEDGDSVASSSSLHPASERKGCRRSYARAIVLIAWQLMLCTVMFLSGAAMMGSDPPHGHHQEYHDKGLPIERQCAGQLSIYSPLLDAVEYEERNFTDPTAGADSGYVGQPTKAMEKKWKDLADVPAIVIPFDKLPLLNRTEDAGGQRGSRFLTVRPGTPHPWSTGGYVGVTEVFHHLHCLNVLRQYIWRDGYASPGHDDDDERPPLPSMMRHGSSREHTDHCIDTLRQALMCSGDVTPYLVYAGDGVDGDGSWPPKNAREDFQALHKCRRFEPLLKYVWENGLLARRQ